MNETITQLPLVSSYGVDTVRLDLLEIIKDEVKNNVKDSEFFMGHWKKTNCSTTACAIGSVADHPIFIDEGLSVTFNFISIGVRYYTPLYLGKSWDEEGKQVEGFVEEGFINVCHLLKMPLKDAEYLFNNESYTDSEQDDYGDYIPSREDVIKRIEKYIKSIERKCMIT